MRQLEQPVLSSRQVAKIEQSLSQSRGSQGYSEDEFIELVRQCELIILGAQAVRGVLDGYYGIDLRDGNITFYQKGVG